MDSLAKQAQVAALSASNSGNGGTAGASTTEAAGTETEVTGVLPTAAALPAATGAVTDVGVAAAEVLGLCSSKLSCAREAGVKAATKNTQGLLGASCDHCVPLEGSAVDLPTNEMFVNYLVTMVVLAAVRSPTSAARVIGSTATEATPSGSISARQPAAGSLAGATLVHGSTGTAAAPLDGCNGRQPRGGDLAGIPFPTGNNAMPSARSGNSNALPPLPPRSASRAQTGQAPQGGGGTTLTRSSSRRTHTVAKPGGGNAAPAGSFAAAFAPHVRHISDEEATIIRRSLLRLLAITVLQRVKLIQEAGLQLI